MFDVLVKDNKVGVLNSFTELCSYLLHKAERAVTTSDKMLLATANEFSFYSEKDGVRYTVKRNGVVKEDLF